MILCHLKMARNCSYPNWRKIMNYVLQVRVYWVNSVICRIVFIDTQLARVSLAYTVPISYPRL